MFKKLEILRSLPMKINELRQNPSFKAIFFIVIVIFFTYLFIAQSLTVVQYRYQMANLQVMLTDKENENKLLVEQIEKKTTDQYIEETARTQLGMVKSNETPVKIIEKDVEKSETVTIESTEKISIYMKDWYVELQGYIDYLKQK